jgi:hypothetical protein
LGALVPAASRDTSLKLLPDIASRVSARAEQFNQGVSGYVGILIWNQVQAPSPLTAEPDSASMARVNVPCHFSRKVAPLLAQVAGASGLSENAAAEALIARDLRSGSNVLHILAKRGSTVVRIR